MTLADAHVCPTHWFDSETSRVTPEGDEITVDAGWIACVATVVNGGDWCADISSPFAGTCWPHADWDRLWVTAPEPGPQLEAYPW